MCKNIHTNDKHQIWVSSYLWGGGREKKRKGGKSYIGKGSEVAFIVFVDFFLKLVAAAWVLVISASIPTCMFETVHKNRKENCKSRS